MTDQDTQQIIETQRQDWSRVAPGWEKWDWLLDRNLAFVNHRLVGDARLRLGQRVLDLGSGTGYPSVLAAQAVGPEGSITGLDLSDAMLAAARRKAAKIGLSNVTFQTGDVSTLPFDKNSFDAVISRFCLMFLPDVPKAVAEIARVLRPGGYFAAAVWAAPEKNPYLNISTGVLKQFLDIPTPAPNQPWIFRLAKAGDLSGMVEQTGLQGLADEELPGESEFASGEEFLTSVLEVAAPIQGLFAKLTPGQRTEAESLIKQEANRYRRGHGIFLPMTIRVVVGRKPLS